MGLQTLLICVKNIAGSCDNRVPAEKVRRERRTNDGLAR
jgi:hypothetical protein